MRILQMLWGLLVIAGFLFTGWWMKNTLDPLGDMSLERMMYRSNHIYLLMSGLVVIVWSQRHIDSSQAIVKWAERLANSFIVVAPLLFGIAFALEAGVEESLRIWTFWAVIVQFSGVMMSVLLTVFIYLHSRQLERR